MLRPMRGVGRSLPAIVAVALAVGVVWLGLASSASGRDELKQVLLDEGARPSYKWGMLAHRGRGREGGRRPCIVVVILHRVPGFGVSESDDTLCGPLPKGGPPQIRSYIYGEGSDQLTIFALAFEPRIAWVHLDLGQVGKRSIYLHKLNRRQTELAHLRPFRFKTFSVKGPFCLGEVVGYTASHEEIYRAPATEC
jgi:hypothetical protein